MWLLHHIPTNLSSMTINLLLIIGNLLTIVGVISRSPAILPYKLIICIAGILCLSLGLYLKGGVVVEIQWRDRVAKLEEKVKLAEAKSQQVNTVIETKVVTKFKTIHDTKIITKEVIKEVAVKIDSECNVAPEAIEIHNAAAHNTAPIPNLASPKEEVK